MPRGLEHRKSNIVPLTVLSAGFALGSIGLMSVSAAYVNGVETVKAENADREQDCRKAIQSLTERMTVMEAQKQVTKACVTPPTLNKDTEPRY